MIHRSGSNIDLKSYTLREYHALWSRYIPDPIMDPNTYVYNKKRVDLQFHTLTLQSGWYKRLGIFLKDGTVIGELSIKDIQYDKDRCEIGIALVDDSVKGHGYGSEAVSLGISYIHDVLGIHHIYGDTMGQNIRMQKIFEKFGFELVERIKNVYDMYYRFDDRLNYVKHMG